MASYSELSVKKHKGFTRSFLSQMKWFFISAAIVVVIAFILVSAPSTHIGKAGLSTLMAKYFYIWLALRVVIISMFLALWPVFIKRVARSQAWPDDYTDMVLKRRWRYAVWLVLIDLCFQLL